VKERRAPARTGSARGCVPTQYFRGTDAARQIAEDLRRSPKDWALMTLPSRNVYTSAS
jgi:hypothetical protein